MKRRKRNICTYLVYLVLLPCFSSTAPYLPTVRIACWSGVVNKLQRHGSAQPGSESKADRRRATVGFLFLAMMSAASHGLSFFPAPSAAFGAAEEAVISHPTTLGLLSAS